MTISKKLGLGVALAALGSLTAAACTSSSCTAACDHVINCLDAVRIDAGVPTTDAGTFCQDECAPDGGGGYGSLFPDNTCKNPGAGYDCLAGLSCQDALSIIDPGEPQTALHACAPKAECDGGY